MSRDKRKGNFTKPRVLSNAHSNASVFGFISTSLFSHHAAASKSFAMDDSDERKEHFTFATPASTIPQKMNALCKEAQNFFTLVQSKPTVA